MARFVEGDKLNAALIDLIKNADEYLFLISPYIKLHSRIKDQLKLKKGLPELQIIVVFGKAEAGQSNRISEDDLAFLKEFPNIEIRYEKNLHAKYYASEDGALITSLNLYDFSQNNNIEAGVWMETPKTLVGKLTGWSMDSELDDEAFNFFNGVIENSDCLFKKEAFFEDGLFGLRRKYIESKIVINTFDDYFNRALPKAPGFSGFKTFEQKTKYQPSFQSKSKSGFCIRTGKEIPFNQERPFSYQAYQNWAEFENWDYQERYCHFSGEASNGETSYRYPILKKNWKKSKEEGGE